MKSGILLIDKPKGITSHDVIYRVRKKTGIKKVGHTGTLDPMATGLLPILINKATKISDYLLKSDKVYIAGAKFGIETDTLDITGEVLKKEDFSIDEAQLLACLKNFLGTSMQIPPMYSAKKIGGKKLYELAREGITIDREPRKINISKLELINFSKGEFEILVNCSSGTYIRSLIFDIAKSLNTIATMTYLRRIKTSEFDIKNSITLSELENLNTDEIEERLISIPNALYHIKKFYLPDFFYDKIINGVRFSHKNSNNEELLLFSKGQFIGIGKSEDGFIKLKKRLLDEVDRN